MTTKNTKLLSPCIHMNGTSQEALVREYEAAWEAVKEAMNVMQKITVNGRDYYPYDSSATNFDHLRIAEGQHRNRMLRLSSVLLELEALINNIASDDRQQHVTVDIE